MIQITQHRNKCIGCNACVEADAENWRMSRKDGKSVLIGATQKKHVFVLNLPDPFAESANRAREVCPVKIIQVKQV